MPDNVTSRPENRLGETDFLPFASLLPPRGERTTQGFFKAGTFKNECWRGEIGKRIGLEVVS